jgi:hypothetical protein
MDNEIYSTPASGAGSSRPINYNAAATNVNIKHNILFFNASVGNGIFFQVTVDPSLIIKDNVGYNPQGYAVITPTFPTTGVDQANNSASPTVIYITGVGGGITAYGITDTFGTLTSYTRTVNVGDYFTLDPLAKIRFTITSGTPTWKWYGL